MTAKNMIAAVDNDALHANLVDEAVCLEPVFKAEGNAGAVDANSTVDVTSVVSNAEHDARGASAKLRRSVRITDAQLINQLCIEYGCPELCVNDSSNRVELARAAEYFHKHIGGKNRDKPVVALAYMRKYMSKGIDGVPAPAEWLAKVDEYIARLKADREAKKADR
ncbi:hypothetical protein [Burkholderia ubonensis]|uniref:hypothetical protein n=1 Tax=Burkholderia ubonensis TaxID=101571 RepID=UPI000A9FF311|nr:hypothetical protein [Burkholderia ubonensis]